MVNIFCFVWLEINLFVYWCYHFISNNLTLLNWGWHQCGKYDHFFFHVVNNRDTNALFYCLILIVRAIDGNGYGGERVWEKTCRQATVAGPGLKVTCVKYNSLCKRGTQTKPLIQKLPPHSFSEAHIRDPLRKSPRVLTHQLSTTAVIHEIIKYFWLRILSLSCMQTFLNRNILLHQLWRSSVNVFPFKK